MVDETEATPEEGNETLEEAAEASSPKKKTLIAYAAVALFCVVSAATVGIIAFPDVPGPEVDPAHEEVTEAHEAELTKVNLPVTEIIVNLQGSDNHRLLKTELTLDLEVTGHAGDAPDINEMLPKVRDQLIKVLSSFTASEIDGGATMVFIQTRIKDRLNNDLFRGEDVKVTDVYFTSFIVQ